MSPGFVSKLGNTSEENLAAIYAISVTMNVSPGVRARALTDRQCSLTQRWPINTQCLVQLHKAVSDRVRNTEITRKCRDNTRVET